jgi:hypothetical protein
LQLFPSANESRQFTITWLNSARFSGRPLIYVLTLMDT